MLLKTAATLEYVDLKTGDVKFFHPGFPRAHRDHGSWIDKPTVILGCQKSKSVFLAGKL